MQIIVKSRHTVVPMRLRKKATEKFERLEKLLDRIQIIDVALGESHNPRVGDKKNHVEVTLATTSGRLHAEAYGPDLLSTVDAAIAKVEAQIRRLKGKTIDRHRRSGGHVEADLDAARVAVREAEASARAETSSA